MSAGCSPRLFMFSKVEIKRSELRRLRRSLDGTAIPGATMGRCPSDFALPRLAFLGLRGSLWEEGLVSHLGVQGECPSGLERQAQGRRRARAQPPGPEAHKAEWSSRRPDKHGLLPPWPPRRAPRGHAASWVSPTSLQPFPGAPARAEVYFPLRLPWDSHPHKLTGMDFGPFRLLERR